MSFKIGDKVVCLIGSVTEGAALIKGDIYTCMGESSFYKGEMRIKELPHPRLRFWCAPFEWFRKLDESFANEVLEKIKEEILTEQLQEV